MCVHVVESIHWQTASSAFLCLFAKVLEHLLNVQSLEVNLDKLFVFLSKFEEQVDLDSIHLQKYRVFEI